LPRSRALGRNETQFGLVLREVVFDRNEGQRDRRIYIELYAGAGYSRIRETLRIVAGSPLRALPLPHPFDRSIFCEKDSVSIESLKVRVKRIAPRADVVFIPGDCNDRMPDLLAAIPAGSREDRVLSLCFVDPCDIGIKFKTIRQLSNRYIDFLVLLALHMDANRPRAHYLHPKSTKSGRVPRFPGLARPVDKS